MITTTGCTLGCRIPKEYFEACGQGESDIAVHAGSFHLALKDAGIEKYNIMTYSSILPEIATLLPQAPQLPYGCVVESIMSTCTVEKGNRGTAGIIYGRLYHRQTGEKYGGLVCENYGDYSKEALKDILDLSLQELYSNGFQEEYRLQDITYLSESVVPIKAYGTALVALCFSSYEIPQIATVSTQ